MSKTLSIVGLALTILGAVLIAWPELFPRPVTMGELSGLGPPRRTLRIGLSLIAVGSALQIGGVATA